MPALPAQQPPPAGAILAGFGLRRLLAQPNGVVPVLAGCGLLAALTSGFLGLAPNRLVSGRPILLAAAADWWLVALMALLGLALLAISRLPPRRGLYGVASLLAGLLLLTVLLAAGRAAAALSEGAPGPARISLGAAFWVLLATASLALIDAVQRAEPGPLMRLLVALALLAVAAAMAAAGLFDALSLAQEYKARQDLFAAAVLRHMLLAAASVVPALLIGLPLGVMAARRPRLQGPLFAVLNLLQTIPSIALFGLLLVPLSALASAVPVLAALGVGGVGPAPAIMALILYALLPVARNSAVGIGGVDPGVVEAARGIGMTRRQLFWQIELPLALPLLLAGLRVVLVQTIGLAVIAALIGAGGLGSFVFAGLGQYAADLVLLGALPAIGLALAADFLLRLAAGALARR